MKIAIVGDSHADSQGDLDDHDAVMSWVVRDATEHGCAALVHTGDVFERRSTSQERASVADWVQLAVARMHVVIVAGNHDDPRDIQLLGRLEHDQYHQLAAITQPRAMTLSDGSAEQIHLFCLPWPQKGRLVASSESREQAGDNAQQAMRALLHGWAMSVPDAPRMRTPRIFAGHCMVRGSSVGENQPRLVGADFELGLEDLAIAQCDFYALGHIHLGQQWDVPSMRAGLGGRVVYPGSPRHSNFGEPDAKRYLIYDTKTGEITERLTPCRPMLLLEVGFTADASVQYPAFARESAPKIRLRYTTSQEESTAARMCAEQLRDKLLTEGAHSVKLDPVVQVTTRSRAPEVAKAVTVSEKLCAHWEAAEDAPPTPDREELLRRLALLEQEQAL